MQFYKIQGIMPIPEEPEEQQSAAQIRKKTYALAMKIEEFNQQFNKEAFFTVVEAEDEKVTMCAIITQEELFEAQFMAFLLHIGYSLSDYSVYETTLSGMQNLLNVASRERFIEDDDEVLDMFELRRIANKWGRNLEYGENLVEDVTRDAVEHLCNVSFMNGTMLKEVDRIYKSSGTPKPVGHPVHYILEIDDTDRRKEIYRGLLGALYANGRINNRRYAYLNFEPGADFSRHAYDSLYKSSAGGAIVVRFSPSTCSEEDDYASTDRDIIHTIGEKLVKYRNQVLTVLCLPRECAQVKKLLFEEMDNIAFVELKEDLAEGKRAKDYLRFLAKESNIKSDRKLYSGVEEGVSYLPDELRRIFDEWYDDKLRTSVYPEYTDAATVKKTVQLESPKGSAYDELNEMIGLASAKEVINNALDYYKAQKLFKEKGMSGMRPSMHMVFTGNPGSAKTTVARLFARIMRDNDVLSKGHMVECGRSDLVGRYVGWTAVQVKRKFKEASGGVLFIDEAYSLVDDRDGSFGDEAINTIVQEMENHRDDVVCVFAGYPDKMDGFLKKNPGLRSRIAFHVKFDDYSVEELCAITELIAKKKGLVLEDGVADKLADIYEEAIKMPDFGNGRAARNIVEKAMLSQASRLVKIDYDKITEKDISTIKAEDIKPLEITPVPQKRRIGFCA